MDVPKARPWRLWRKLRSWRSRLNQETKGAYIALFCLLPLLGLVEYMQAFSPLVSSDTSQPILVGLAPLASRYAHFASEITPNEVSSQLPEQMYILWDQIKDTIDNG
jgi:hypothetical protein